MRKSVLKILRRSLMSVALLTCMSCSGQRERVAATEDAAEPRADVPVFSADSAYSHVRTQVGFGPRVPNSEAHRRTGDWLLAKLREYGAETHEQAFDVKAFDGTMLHGRNIFARYNPSEGDRLLLLAHYDTRPWADQDSDPTKRSLPIDGANDGASGVAVLLETARNISLRNPGIGIDILFVDAEDYGTDGDDDSWALGARHFADNMGTNGWIPSRAILLDMVGGLNASFPYEYFSQQAAPDLNEQFRMAANTAGYASYFPRILGGAITDDHVKLIEKGIKAIDIIDYDPQKGFNPTWHTHDDNIGNIDPAALKAVGQSLLQFIYQ